MSFDEFLKNPQAQDQVFKTKFGQYLQQTGNPQDAASMWFSGKPLAQAGTTPDVLGTTPKAYVDKFTAAGGAGPQVAQAPPMAPLPQIQPSPEAARTRAQADQLRKIDPPKALQLYERADQEEAKWVTDRAGKASDISMQGQEHDRQQNQPMPTEMAKIRTAQTDAITLMSALDDYEKAITNAPRMDRIKSITGAATPLNTAYSNAAMLAKGETLFNLGVLSGPDLDIIRRTLADPSTFAGSLSSREDVKGSVDKVRDLIQTRLGAHEQRLGLPITDVRGATATMRATQPGGAPPPSAGGNELLDQAREAIRQGKDKAKVIEVLKANGGDPGQL